MENLKNRWFRFRDDNTIVQITKETDTQIFVNHVDFTSVDKDLFITLLDMGVVSLIEEPNILEKALWKLWLVLR